MKKKKVAAPATIPVLDMTVVSRIYPNTPVYGWHQTFPNLRFLSVRPTIAEAYHDATEWVRGFQSANPFSNLAKAHGVTAQDNGYVGVVSFLKSNT